MQDLISRQAAIDAVMKYGKQIPTFAIAVKDALENLPSAHLENERQATVSSDCVSRQDLINWLSYIESHCLEEYAYGYHKTRAYVEQMPSAQPEQRWIPCSERLPELDDEVLVTDDGGELRHCTFCTWGETWCGFVTYEEDMRIIATAWMPMPPAYKGE